MSVDRAARLAAAGGKTRKEGRHQRSWVGLSPGLQLYADHHTALLHLCAMNKSLPPKKPLAFLNPFPGGQKASDVVAVCLFPGSRERVRGGGGQRYPRTRIWRGDTAWSV